MMEFMFADLCLMYPHDIFSLKEYASSIIMVNISPNKNTVWLTVDQLCTLFNKNKSTISRHIKNIFNEGELDEISSVAKNATQLKRYDLIIDGKQIISDSALVAITLMIAESRPEEKETMVKLVMNFLNA